MINNIIIGLRNVKNLTKNEAFSPISKDVCQVYNLMKGDKVVKTLTGEDIIQSGLTAKELNDIAITNMKAMYNPVLGAIEDVMLALGFGGKPTNLYKMKNKLPHNMYVLTTEIGNLGASVILVPGVKERLLELFDESIIVVPSSPHELLLIPASTMTKEDAKSMLLEVNDGLEMKDILSSEIYIIEKRDRNDKRRQAFRVSR